MNENENSIKENSDDEKIKKIPLVNKKNGKIINVDDKKTFLVIFCVILLVLGFIVQRNRNQIKEVAALNLHNVELSNLSDGIYKGKCYTSFQHVSVEVTIKNHIIVKVNLVENEGSKGQLSKNIAEKIVKENKIIVTPVENDELGSYVIMAAVMNALESNDESEN